MNRIHEIIKEELAQYEAHMGELNFLRKGKTAVLERAKKWAEKNTACKGEYIGFACCKDCAIGEIFGYDIVCYLTANRMLDIGGCLHCRWCDRLNPGGGYGRCQNDKNKKALGKDNVVSLTEFICKYWEKIK